MFALVDCANFFVSCEQVFRPDLLGKPVVVLSNNDGCVIARSEEVKALGVGMGVPVFEVRDLFRRHDVRLFSSNFALYGDISRRVMSALSTFSSEMEVYSIDEAFLQFSDEYDYEELGRQIRETVMRWVGVPVRVGFGKTKTLAKLSNTIAKKSSSGVFCIHFFDEDLVMKEVPVKSVWGVGRRHAEKMEKIGVRSVYDLKHYDEGRIRQMFHLPGIQTQLELKGTACIRLEGTAQMRKSILSSRSFGKKTGDLGVIQGAVASNVNVASQKLRAQHLASDRMRVFIREKGSHETHSVLVRFPEATSATGRLLRLASKAVESLVRPGVMYDKSGVLFLNLVSEFAVQQPLFGDGVTGVKVELERKLYRIVDRLNAKWGRDMVTPAICGVQERPWKMNQNFKSPRYTTSWLELPLVRV